MEIKDVIITDMSFSVSFSASKIYHVDVYTQDADESDTYVIEIKSIYNDEKYIAYVDSCGGMLEDTDNEVVEKVVDFLFTQKEQSIIQAF